jgi:hypothetical protein
MRRLQYLPWRSLFLTSVVTLFCVTVLSYAVGFSSMNSPIASQIVATLYTPPWVIITNLAVSIAVGTVSVYFLETLFPQTAINANILWTLILCLMVMLIIKSFLPLPEGLLAVSEISLVGIILGVFLVGGRRYWR